MNICLFLIDLSELHLIPPSLLMKTTPTQAKIVVNKTYISHIMMYVHDNKNISGSVLVLGSKSEIVFSHDMLWLGKYLGWYKILASM